VRSVLEYCAPVWHTSIPAFLSDEVEKVQKRAFRILNLENHYDEALAFGAIRMFSIARTSFFAMQKDFQNDMPADITAE
jgi:hypothetical protein